MSNNKIDNLSPDWGIMLTMQSTLNLRIGTQTWKKYISAAFWNYISTPINFTITLFTALSAGQTGTNSNYLSEKQLFIMLFISFLLSIINTFFKLKEKAVLNYDASKKYDEFGAKFEEIYYMSLSCEDDMKNKLRLYKILQEEINKYSQKENIENANYFTELIFLIFYCCFEDKLKRINKKYRYWYLDGLTYDKTRYENPWNIEEKNYFIYDISGQATYMDEEERKNNKYKNKNYNTSNSYYDVEMNSVEHLSTKNRKLDKKEIIKDIHNRELLRINENKQMFVKEKIANCIENRLSLQKKQLKN
jgi:hypothetical protein